MIVLGFLVASRFVNFAIHDKIIVLENMWLC
jgi:hypothetical protein